MTWPPQTPDLSPIELEWDKLDKRVQRSTQRVNEFFSMLEKYL